MHTRLWLVFGMALALLIPPAGAQTPALDAAIEDALRAGRTPGLTVAVVKTGKTLWCKGYGFSDPVQGVAAGPDSVYSLASLTKPLTATGVLLLVQDGKIALNDPVGKFVPNAPPAWAGITVEHMLTHTSGLPDFINDKAVPQDRDVTLDEMIQLVAKLPLQCEPGARRSYSNTNYLLLGEVIRVSSGLAWDEFLAQRVFAPLEMTHTRKRDATLTRGFMKDGDAFVPAWPLRASIFDNADGGLVSTAADLARFDIAIRSGRVLKPDAVPQSLAWEANDVRGRLRIEHGGRRSGASAQFTHFPDDNLTVIVLGNSVELDAVDVVELVAATVNPVYSPVRLMKPVASRDSTLDAQARRWIRAVAEGDTSAAVIAPGSAGNFIPDAAPTMKRLLASESAFEQIMVDHLPRPSRRNGHDATAVAYYRWSSRGETIFPMFYFDAAGRIVDYDAVRYGRQKRSSSAVWIGVGTVLLAAAAAVARQRAKTRKANAVNT